MDQSALLTRIAHHTRNVFGVHLRVIAPVSTKPQDSVLSADF
jgi:hypothetical protein